MFPTLDFTSRHLRPLLRYFHITRVSANPRFFASYFSVQK